MFLINFNTLNLLIPFTSETAREAGRKSKRGKAKMTLTMRQFIFQILKKNQSKFQYYLDELTPRQFVDVYMRLIPYIVQMRHLQNIEVGELSKDETREIIKDIVKDENPN